MSYIQGEDRRQITLFADSIEEMIASDNHVRGIEAFVMSLDMADLGFLKAEPAGIGRNPYDPRDLLKLYIYGYLNGIRSSRKLEAETHRNIELMWLICKLKPDFKTIADFRRDNKVALVKVFRQFNVLCKDWQLFSKSLIAVDGSKFRASNSKRSNFSQKKIKRNLAYLDERIDEYMKVLDQTDEKEADLIVPTADEIKQRLAELQNRKRDYEIMLNDMQIQGINEVSTTDPDARMMSVNNNGLDVCYNVQTVVDAEHKLVVDCEVINNPTDHGQLNKMASRAKEVLGVEELQVLADKGYYSTNDLVKCEEADLTTYVAKPRRHGTQDEEFQLDKFVYDAEKDLYLCPAGQELYPGKTRKINDVEYRDYKNQKICRICKMKDRCTKMQKGRVISRNLNQAILDQVDRRTEENKALYRRRQMIVEHPFGTLKRQWGFGHFLTRGLSSVKTEISLAFLAYNLRRVMNILGVEEMKMRLSSI
ncbi:MAG: IS1182 family transposase [Chryseosolibacter sp.]